jgi:hypothetical protein
VALSAGQKQLLVFSRFRAEGEPPSTTAQPKHIVTDILAIEIGNDASCSKSAAATLDIGPYTPPKRNDEVETEEEWTSRAYARLRARPVLFELTPDNQFFAVVPDTDYPARARRFWLQLP